jgi:hypothetical protein
MMQKELALAFAMALVMTKDIRMRPLAATS